MFYLLTILLCSSSLAISVAFLYPYFNNYKKSKPRLIEQVNNLQQKISQDINQLENIGIPDDEYENIQNINGLIIKLSDLYIDLDNISLNMFSFGKSSKKVSSYHQDYIQYSNQMTKYKIKQIPVNENKVILSKTKKKRTFDKNVKKHKEVASFVEFGIHNQTLNKYEMICAKMFTNLEELKELIHNQHLLKLNKDYKVNGVFVSSIHLADNLYLECIEHIKYIHPLDVGVIKKQFTTFVFNSNYDGNFIYELDLEGDRLYVLLSMYDIGVKCSLLNARKPMRSSGGVIPPNDYRKQEFINKPTSNYKEKFI